MSLSFDVVESSSSDEAYAFSSSFTVDADDGLLEELN